MQTVMMADCVMMIDNGMVSYQSRPPRYSTVDHRVIVLHVHAGAFFVIKRGAQVGEINAGFHGNVGEFHIRRIRKA